jgi:hypothetical protein
MKISKEFITIRELSENYRDNNDGGVYGYDNGTHILCLRPEYQREYVFGDKQRNAVIDTVMKGFPLGLIYWSKVSDNQYECLDGQQRSISICQYVNSDFPIKVDGNDRFFHNLTLEEKQAILDYELEVRICEGTEEEKLAWFRTINIAGVTLTNQELLNATYAGTWLADAKNFFSKRNCVAGQFADGYIKGNPIRQDYLEKALAWIADRDGLESGGKYMAIHQHDADANDLWVYFQEVIGWAKRMFPNMSKKLTECQDWGILYNQYRNKQYNTNEIRTLIDRLLQDEDVTKQTGIIPYVLSDRTKHDEKYLSIRAFSEQIKRRVYERQGHKCPFCVANGVDTEYAFEEMQGDHIIPWSQGGRTVEDNCQMLCQRCNNDKSAQ